MLSSLVKKIQIIDLGVVEYKSAYQKQMEFHKQVTLGHEPVILLCEHPTVITMGRMSKREHMLLGEDLLKQKGVAVEYIDRGGDITLHAPGQLVAYPIMDLNDYKKDLHDYLFKLEEACIRLLESYGLDAKRFSGRTGVWVGAKKIVSIGVGVKKWVTYHGVGINVSTDLGLFSMIKPCGLDVAMTSISQEKATHVPMDEVKLKLGMELKRVFKPLKNKERR